MTSQLLRKIIHIDMDAFYASVELRDRPQLRGLPMVVASDRPRSVVTTATYEARQFGLHSAMSLAKAKQLCPQVICVPPDFAKYRAVSQQLQTIFAHYTDKVEPISLDEAYLDVTENFQGLSSATAVAQAIRQDIFEMTQLTASAGVAPNKFLAKIASDWNKPNGLFVVKPAQVSAFIQHLPLEKIPGVGKVTLQKMHTLQWYCIADLQSVTEHELIHHFGKFGQRLFLYAKGVDDRPVRYTRERQQISKEITFDQDYYLEEIAVEFWQKLIDQIWQQLQQKKLTARGVQVKFKTTDFKVLQHSRSFKQPFVHQQQLQQAVEMLFLAFADQHFRFRLAGVGVFALEELQDQSQLTLL
ncbi:DNA polymerase IV [Acinetobacter qingfengensis]|uniref:DNA polymerase IV n=1 Tax=Acinetobacter qingfengensis TaxID=1262585 RepID=A0A1E7RCU9_9GAMM|nr:DNA polymerase IV [Acinetobacter qingfengensis]KAA8732082.1 DNA polymerase IV [Acinetobacter qingfengensis]OEY97161.1 DNA polymerase IV [Acinetobacter qingfengensis]